MIRALTVSILFFFLSESFFAQDVSAVYDVNPVSTANEYTIKTTITGLIGVDIASIKYLINNNHTYQPSPNNQLFSDRNENYIKFYIMAVPTSGIINVEFGIILGGSENYSFPVELQYSRNEEKKVLNLPEISIKDNGILAVAETPKPIPPIVKEEPIVEDAKQTSPVVKEVPILEVAKSTPPIIKEEPVVEVVKPTPPTVMEKPIVEIAKPVTTIVKEEPVAKVPQPTPPIIKEEPVVEIPQPTPLVVKTKPIVEVPKPTTTVKETPSMLATNKVGTKYTVQLLSLLEFSEIRVNNYCKLHHIPLDKIKKIKKGEWMKITYGETNSIEEANQIIEKLKNEHQVKDAFIVPLN